MAPSALEAAVQFLGVLIGILVYFPRVEAAGNFLEMTSFHNDGEMNLFDASVYSSNRTQYGRIFQFNKQDTAIRVELAFAIPFLSIPVKTKPGSEKKNYLVDVNLGALAAGGIFTVASLLFIPKLFNGLAPQVSYSRSESEAGGLTGILSRLDETLMEHNIDTATCTQRAVCWLVNSAVDKVNTGTGSSMDKIVDGIVSNRWMQKMVKGTAIQEAIDNGKKGKNCSVLYSRCPLTQEVIQAASRHFISDIN